MAISFTPRATFLGKGRANNKFYVNSNYDNVRRALIRGNALQVIVEANSGKLLDHHWIDFNINAQKLIKPKDWNIDGKGVFRVQYHNDYVGNEEVMFNQSVAIRPNEIIIKSVLADQPTKKLKSYHYSMHIQSSGNGTIITTDLELSVLVTTWCIFATEEYINNQVIKAAQGNLAKGEEAFRNIIQTSPPSRVHFQLNKKKK